MAAKSSVVVLADIKRQRQRAAIRNYYSALRVLEAEAPGMVSTRAREAVDADLRPAVEADQALSERKDFFMGFEQVLLPVWRWIGTLPRGDRPQDVRRVLDECIGAIEWDTGEVRIDRSTIAERASITPARVSLAMTVLERHGVVERSHIPEPGKRGRKARYFLNCHVAWRGRAAARDELRDLTDPPLLTLMQGGKREHHAARDLSPAL